MKLKKNSLKIFYFFYLDVICNDPPGVGYPCSSGEPQLLYYYELPTGSCKELHYQGCGGNENRFSNTDECRRFCRPVGPKPID